MTHSLIEARRLTVRYGSLLALDAVELHLAPGEAVALVGVNGAGKSTLLRAMAGLQAADGEVVVRVAGARPSRGHVAYVPQRSTARWDFPISAADAVLTGREPYRRRGGRWSRHDRLVAREAMERMGVAHLGARPVGSLSGGQAQRVLLARALAQEPQVLLLDEPLTGLDAEARAEVRALVLQVRDSGPALLCALHELEVARADFARTVALRSGRLIGDGPSADVLGPLGLERLLLPSAS